MNKNAPGKTVSSKSESKTSFTNKDGLKKTSSTMKVVLKNKNSSTNSSDRVVSSQSKSKTSIGNKEVVKNTSSKTKMVLKNQSSASNSTDKTISSKSKSKTSVSSKAVAKKTTSSKTKIALKKPTNYTIRKIVPAEKPELISVAKAMHQEKFGRRVQKLFSPETNAAIEAIQTGIYVGWRIPGQKWDCIRVGMESKCFCGCKLSQHKPHYFDKRVGCLNCKCEEFRFVPGRPEDVGEFWLKKRRNFDESKWRAKCRCKCPHDHHDQKTLKCKKCSCFRFEILDLNSSN